MDPLPVNSLGEQKPIVLGAISSILNRVVCRNAVLGGAKPPETPFHGKIVPWIPIDKYLERLFIFADCSDTCWIIAYIFMDKFIKRRRPALILEPHSVHRILLSAVLLAAKYHDDSSRNNVHFAMAGGVSLETLNHLEAEFFKGVGYQLYVAPIEFNYYCTILQREMNFLKFLLPPPPFSPSPPASPNFVQHCPQFLEYLSD
ncbi:hypothetical protein LUZ60_016890 [Juncus effusus]|nr:hypothetical protein LUZ60_016890 [Juncus effusus]